VTHRIDQPDLWLGIDVGTQSVKASIVADDGTVVSVSTAPLTSERWENRHEQAPAQWIDASTVAVAATVSVLPHDARLRIRGIAVCATSGTITTVDPLGRPTTTGLMYDDARAGSIAAEAHAADPARWARLGYRIQPSWALPKIAWLQRHGLLPVGDHIATQADVVASSITGGPVTSDSSHTLKSGYDLLANEWPQNVLEALRIDPLSLPEVVAPGTVLGVSSPEFCDATGLPVGVTLFAGMTDGCAAQIGAGTLALGDWHSVIGTTLVVKGVSDRIVVDDTGAVYSHRAPHNGLWFPGGASSVGAGAVSARNSVETMESRTDRVAARYDGRLGEIPLGYPLTGTGERFPMVLPTAAGFIRTPSGRHATLADAASAFDEDAILASIFLGVALVERLSVATMAAAGVPVSGTFTTSGGGTRNRWWTSLRADVLKRDLVIPQSSEGSVGMAVLAAWAHHVRYDTNASLTETATRMSPSGSTVATNRSRHGELDDIYGSFVAELQTIGWLP
jgi:sugar (pentulose or hexulose) kinase